MYESCNSFQKSGNIIQDNIVIRYVSKIRVHAKPRGTPVV